MKLGNQIVGSAQLFRQVHPNHYVDGRVTSAAFKPTPKDEGMLSVTDAAKRNAADDHAFHTAKTNAKGEKLRSCGVLCVTADECKSLALGVIEAPLCVADDPTDRIDDDAHTIIDFRELEKKEVERRARALNKFAVDRNFVYVPPSDEPSIVDKIVDTSSPSTSAAP
jgi:hypothetical protein